MNSSINNNRHCRIFETKVVKSMQLKTKYLTIYYRLQGKQTVEISSVNKPFWGKICCHLFVIVWEVSGSETRSSRWNSGSCQLIWKALHIYRVSNCPDLGRTVLILLWGSFPCTFAVIAKFKFPCIYCNLKQVSLFCSKQQNKGWTLCIYLIDIITLSFKTDIP